MAAEAFAAPITALLVGEILAWRLSGHVTVNVIQHLQRNVSKHTLDASFPGWLRERVEASITTSTGIPTLYLTLIALADVPRVARWSIGWVGYALAVIGTLAILAYGWGKLPPNIVSKRLCRLSVPAFSLLLLNLLGLVLLV